MKIRSIVNKIRFPFIVLYFINLALNLVLPFVIYSSGSIKMVFNIIIISMGLIITLYDLISHLIFKKDKIDKTTYLLFGLILSALISSILNIKYGYIDNFKTIIWSILLFINIYNYCKNNKNCNKEINVLIWILLFIWVIPVSYSLYQFSHQISYTVVSDIFDISKGQGFVYNRLLGIFIDPNYAAVFSCLLLFLSIRLFDSVKKNIVKVLLIIVNIPNILYIILSNSRTAYLVLLIGTIIFLFFIIRNNNYFKKNNTIKVIFVTILLTVALSLVFLGIKKILSYVPGTIYKLENINNNFQGNDPQINNNVESENNIIPNDNVNQEDEIKNQIDLNRTDLDSKEDFTNMRIELWSDSLKIYKSKPLFGTSIRNFIPYAKDKYTDLMPAKGYDVGNGYLVVLVGTGIFGFSFMILFICYVIYYLLKNRIMTKVFNNNIYISLCIVIIVAVVAGINTEIFFINDINTGVFWLMLGYLMNNIKSLKNGDL